MDKGDFDPLVARIAEAIRECETPEQAAGALVVAGWRPTDLRAALDAAQDEIEKRIEDAESLRAAFDLAYAEVLKHHTRVDSPEPWCQQCSASPEFADWPCDPVRAIEDALGGAS